jgi:AhpD family alkylhydroperoxidase
MAHFYDHTDRAHLGGLQTHAAPEYAAYVKMNQTIFGNTAGALPLLQRELIAVAVAVSHQCPYCIQSHTKNAAAQGATDAEIAEAAMIAVAIGAGSAATHGAMAMKLFAETGRSD